MLAFSSLSQFVVLCAFLPANFIPWFGGIHPSELGSYMSNASKCFLGQDEAIAADPGCATAGTHWAFCVLTMLLSNLLQALVVKYSSALLSTLVITMVTPCSAFAF